MAKYRNWNAVDAHMRRGGPMKHKNTTRQGATNDTRDLLAQAEADFVHPSEIYPCPEKCCEGEVD